MNLLAFSFLSLNLECSLSFQGGEFLSGIL